MPKKAFSNGEDRFNFMLAVSGYLLRNQGTSTVAEVAQHFDVDADSVVQTLRTLNLAAAKFENRPEDLFYDIDLDELERGVIQFNSAESAPDVPHLTTKQASALAAGLHYLKGIPEFATQDELNDLLELLGAGDSAQISVAIDVKPASDSSNAELIRKAIIDNRQISCEYLNQRGESSERTIDPLTLSLDGQFYYLAGWCHLAEDMRIFRLDRMRKLAILDAVSSRSVKEVEDYADRSYVAANSDIEVVVEVTPEAYRLISETQAIAEPKDQQSATIRATIRVGNLQNLGRLIAKYGGAARVIAPEAAREVVKNYALRMLGEDIQGDLAGSEE